MGIKTAYDALTNPTPTNRDFLICWISECALRRVKGSNKPTIDDIYWIITVMYRWGALTGKDVPKMSRDAIGLLASDSLDAAKIRLIERM